LFAGPLPGRVLVAADDFGDFEKWPVGIGRVQKHLIKRKRIRHHILAQHIGQWRGMSHRLNVVDIQFAELVHIFQDRFELTPEPREPLFTERQTRELRECCDLRFRSPKR